MPPAEVFGIVAILIMVGSYALEQRHVAFVGIFALGCALAAGYAWLIASYPFFIAESIWCVIAAVRFRQRLTATVA